jgi:hypothetical protein
VADASRQYGLPDPLCVHGVFARALERAAAHPDYRSNALQPGAMPFEWSFSASEPEALRIELEPLDPNLGTVDRLRWSAHGIEAAVRSLYGDARAAQFRAAAQICEWRSTPTFGSFIGVSVSPRRPPRLKLYIEEDGADWPEDCVAAAAAAGATPHFRSVAAGADGIAERHYFLCRDTLRLQHLETLCGRIGIPSRAPALILTMLEFTGGDFYLPPRSAVLAIRGSSEPEVKVECFTDRNATGSVRMLLQPHHRALFDRWTRVTRATPNVISVKVSRASGVTLGCYAPEPEEPA